MKTSKKKCRKARSLIALAAIVRHHGGPMKDRRAERGGAKNRLREYMAEV